MAQAKVLGNYVPRIDAAERVTGRARYAADWKMSRMLYGRIVLSDVPHAKIAKLDDSKALALPGVDAVISFQDTKVRWSPGDRVNPRYAIADKVRFAGDVVAAVAARSRQVAKDAAELIDIEYERLPPVFNVEESLREDAPKIWDNGNIHQKFEAAHGDVEEGFKKSKQVFEGTYYTNRNHNSPLEPGASLAWWNGDQLTVVAGTQGITTCRQSLSKDLGLPLSKTRVITLFKGGGFGNKNQVMNYDLIAALLSKKAGKPVLMEYTRREDFINVHGRWSTRQLLKAGVSEDGALEAYEQKVYCDVGAYARHPARYGEAPLAYYDCHNSKSEIYVVYTNTPATGNMRAPDGVPSAFASESMMDEIAYTIGMNPLEFRLKIQGNKHHGEEYVSYGLDQCITSGAETIGWKKKWHPAGKGPTVDRLKHGIGMAMCNWHADLGQGAAIIKLNLDGTVQLAVGVTDIGTGAKSTMGLIAADALGVSLDDVKVISGDTDICPFSIGESGSRTTTFTGMAVKAAVEDAKKQLYAIAATMLDAKPDQLEIKDKTVLVKDQPDRKISLAKVAETMPDAIIGKGSLKGKLPQGKARASFAAHFAEVLVDEDTGVVTLTRYVAAHDSGPIVNKLTAESQVQGGVIMGIGSSLSEELIVNREQGFIDNPSLYTYRVPLQHDVPKIEVIFVETQDPYGPKALGEVPTVPVAPAIANAIFNATGARLRETPMTSEKVLNAVNALRGR